LRPLATDGRIMAGPAMTTIRYSFRPSLFQTERTIVLDDGGITVREANEDDRRVAWADIVEVHLEPATTGDDDKTRWLINLHPRDGKPIRIDSVNVRGTDDFEHKTKDFLDVLDAIHRALAPRGEAVRYRLGVRRWVIVAWQVALLLTLVAGLFGAAVAVMVEEYEALFGAGAFIAFGVVGLSALRGKGGPKAYDPKDFIAARDK
jgi:hypothetical protein